MTKKGPACLFDLQSLPLPTIHIYTMGIVHFSNLSKWAQAVIWIGNIGLDKVGPGWLLFSSVLNGSHIWWPRTNGEIVHWPCGRAAGQQAACPCKYWVVHVLGILQDRTARVPVGVKGLWWYSLISIRICTCADPVGGPVGSFQWLWVPRFCISPQHCVFLNGVWPLPVQSCSPWSFEVACPSSEVWSKGHPCSCQFRSTHRETLFATKWAWNLFVNWWKIEVELGSWHAPWCIAQ